MRRRIHYPDDSVYIGPSPASGYHFSVNGSGVSTEDLDTVRTGLNDPSILRTDITNLVSQVFGVQSYYYNINQNIVPVGGYGTMGPLGYLRTSPSQVEFGFDYIINSLQNEYNFGFNCSGENNILSNLIDYSEDSHNFFIKNVKEGYDSIDYTDNEDTSVISFGNCQMSSYSFAYSVNSFPIARASFSSDNIQVNIDSLTGIRSPYIDKITNEKSDNYFSIPTGRSFPSESGNDQVSILRNGDVSIDVYEKLYQGRRIGISDISDTPSFLGQKIRRATIQSFDCSINIPRDDTPALGSKILKNRSIVSPLYAEVSISALCNDYDTGSFIDSLEENRIYKIDFSVKKPTCDPSSRVDFVKYNFNDCYLQQKSYSLNIGSNKTVDYKFVAPIYSEDNDNYGLKISGFYNPRKQNLALDYNLLSELHAIVWDSQDVRYESMDSKDLGIASGGWNSVDSTDFAVITDITGGSNWQTLTGIDSNIIFITNDTNYQVEVRKNTGSMISKMIQPSSVFEISAITNSNQVDVRRFDRSSTPLSISWEWQKYN
jgi:hypothetical protein